MTLTLIFAHSESAHISVLDCERNPGWGDTVAFHPALVMTDGSLALSC